MSWFAKLLVRQTLLVPGSVAMIVLMGTSLLQPSVVWTGDWQLGLQQLLTADLPVLVLVAVVSGHAAGVLNRAEDRGELLTSARRVSPFLISVAIGVAAPLATLVAGVGWVTEQTWAAGGHTGNPLVWVRFALVILLAGVIGAAAGSRLSALMALPVAAGSIAGAYAVLPAITGFALFHLGGARVPLAGVRPSDSFLASAVLATAGLTVLGMVVGLDHLGRRGVAAVGVLTLLTLAGTAVLPESTFVRTDAAGVCRAPGAVRTCVFPGYGRYGDRLAERAAQMREAAVVAGVPAGLLASGIVQQRPTDGPTRPGQGALILSSADLSDSGVVSDDVVASALTYPAWCPQMDDELPPLGLLNQATYVQAWLLLTSGSVGPQDFGVMVPRGFPDLSANQQRASVIEMLRAARECRAAPMVPTT